MRTGNEDWKGVGKDWSRHAGSVDYFLSVSDSESSQDAQTPLPDMHWVLVHALTGGRGVGAPAPAMTYDPRDAVLEIDDQLIHALPRLWMSESRGLYRVGAEVDVPHNLNEISSDGFFVAFPIAHRRSSSDVYSVRLGSILLDGQRVVIPAAPSCFTPSQTWLAPIH